MTIFVQRRLDAPLGHEEKLIWQYATMEQLKIKSFSPEEMANGDVPAQDASLIVGSVQSVTSALEQLNITAPNPSYYPDCLKSWLYRDVEAVNANHARWMIEQGSTLFVKSQNWKQMTGMVCSKTSHHPEFSAMPSDAMCWISNPVEWLSEYRVYVYQNEIIAISCYEGDESFKLDARVLENAVNALEANNWHDTYAMDWGIIKTPTGELLTALVEMNDAWAIGAYDGINYRQYYNFLNRRWQQLVKSNSLSI